MLVLLNRNFFEFICVRFIYFIFYICKMILIISKFWVPKGFSGITVFPFVIVRNQFWAKNNHFINHEKIHLRQQLEMLVVFFFIWYGMEFLVRCLQYKNLREAYRNISFERDAYANEHLMDYLKNRQFFSWVKYL